MRKRKRATVPLSRNSFADYDRDVLRLALNLMKRPEDARDVYQEAFLKVYRNLHRFRFECSFYTWLYRIVTNVCLDHLRRRQARPEDQAPELNAGVREEGITDFFERQREHRPTLDPERSFIGKEIKNRIALAMERLSPRERIVFEMKHYQGLEAARHRRRARHHRGNCEEFAVPRHA